MLTKPYVDILTILLPLLYGGLVAVYAVSFFRNAPVHERAKTPLLAGIVVLHLLYLVLRTIAFDHPPITSVWEIMTLLALCVALAYKYVEWRTGIRNTGLFILTLALAFQTVASLFIRDMIKIPDYLHSLVLGFHVTSALLGYTAITLSAVYGFLYLMLYHEIKSSRFGMIYTRLPNLETLETMSHKAEVFGFAALTVAIVIGLIWLPKVFTDFSYLDPKLIGTMLIWALYAVGLTAKRKLRLQGRKMMIISLVAFCFIFLSMTVINLYMSGFHSFH